MLVSELLGRAVVDVEGHPLGHIDDLRLVQDGPYVEGFGLALRVADLVVGPGGLAVRLGYVRHGVRGPAAIRAWAARVERRCRLVPWEAVASWDGEAVRLRCAGDQLSPIGAPPG